MDVKTTRKDIWRCGRCEPEYSGKGACPRGGCEAVIVGHKEIVTITETVIYSDREMLDKANEERGATAYFKFNLDFLFDKNNH